MNAATAADSRDGAGSVLATQLQRVQSSLDIYLETMEGAAGTLASSLNGNGGAARDKTFLRAFRSRTRSRPLRAIETSAGSVIYTQV